MLHFAGLSIQKKYAGRRNKNSFDKGNSRLDIREKTGAFLPGGLKKNKISFGNPRHLKHNL